MTKEEAVKAAVQFINAHANIAERRVERYRGGVDPVRFDVAASQASYLREIVKGLQEQDDGTSATEQALPEESP